MIYKLLKTRQQQHGGTMLGVIAGLVIGLGIAVAVAILIETTPTPFTNKLGMNKPADAPPVQLTDPNKPLYGNSYKEAPPHANGAPNPNAPQTTANNFPVNETDNGTSASASDYADSNEAMDAKWNASPAQTVDDEASKPESNTPPPTATPKKPATDKPLYYLQVGAFLDRSDAENVRAKLALLGVESTITSKNSENDNLYRVRIGPFDNMGDMNRARAELVENSIDVAVIKIPR